MKRTVARLFLVVALFASKASANPFYMLRPDPGTGSFTIVNNGSFETGNTTGWSSGGPSSFVASGDQAFGGAFSAKAVPSGSFDGAGFALAQTVPVLPNTEYILSAFFNTEDLTSGNLYVDLNDVVIEYEPGFGNQPGGEGSLLGRAGWWFSYAEIDTGAATSVTVRLVRDGDVQAGEFGYIDSVALTLASEFAPPLPEPTTFALGLIGFLGIVRRRK